MADIRRMTEKELENLERELDLESELARLRGIEEAADKLQLSYSAHGFNRNSPGRIAQESAIAAYRAAKENKI